MRHKKIKHQTVHAVHQEKNRNPRVLLVWVGIAVLCGLMLLTLPPNKNANPVIAPTGLFDTVIAQAEPHLTTLNQTELTAVVEKIKAIPGYETDQNALYVVVMYYIRAGNAVDARTAYAKLLKVYSGENGFSKLLGKTKTMLQLDSDIIFLEEQSKQFMQNSLNGLPSQ